MPYPISLGVRQHLFGSGGRQGQRLLAEYVLALLRGRQGDLLVHAGWSADIYEIDVLALRQPAPVGFYALPSEPGCHRPDLFPVAAAEHGEDRPYSVVEKARDRGVRLAMGPTHLAVADQAYA